MGRAGVSDYIPEIDQFAAEYWKTRSQDRQNEIQHRIHQLGYSLKEWTDALKRNRESQ